MNSSGRRRLQRMASIIFTCALYVLTGSRGAAQPDLYSDDIPFAPGTRMEYYRNLSGTIPVDVGELGGPQVWDFSQGSRADSVLEIIVEKSETPFGDLFPAANLVYSTNGLNIAGIDTASGFQYMSLDEDGLGMLGASSENVLGISLSLVLDSSLTMIPLPLQYGSSWSDDVEYVNIFEDAVENPSPNIFFPDPYLDVMLEIDISTAGEVDAWGTVIVPHGEFEALRVRRDDQMHVKASVFLGFIFVPVYDSTFSAMTYDWHVKNLASVVTVTSQPDETEPNFTEASRIRRLKSTNATGWQAGDVNCDGSITPADALCTFWRSITSTFQQECSCQYSEQAAEANCDGQITPGDALCIFWRSILGQWQEDCSCPRRISFAGGQYNPADQNNRNESLTFNVSPSPEVLGCPGETVSVSIILTDPQTPLDAFSLDLSYPISVLRYISIDVSQTLTEEWFLVAGNEPSPGVITIGGINLDPIEHSGILVKVLFQVNEGQIGQGPLCLSEFVDDLQGAETTCGVFSSENCPTSTEENGDGSDYTPPLSFTLEQNLPNPFNATTDIGYQIADCWPPGHTTLKIFNILGHEVRTVVDAIQGPGYYSVSWDGRNASGQEVTSGIYCYTLSVNGGQWSATKTMTLMK
jgi:hypothetical protein